MVDPPAREERIEVASLNVWGLPWPLSSQRGRRFARVVEHFDRNTVQLAGLQEVWRSRTRRLDLPDLRLPVSRRDTGLAIAGGLAPTSDLTLIHFHVAAGFDRLVRKGVLLARAGELTLAVTHLQAGLLHAPIRARQVAQLIEVVRTVRGPLILMGDFNFYYDSAIDQRSHYALTAAGFSDAAVESGQVEPTYVLRNPFVRGGVRAERFDRIYLRSGGGTRLRACACRVHRRIVSDHLPVHATVGISRSTT